MAICRSFVPCLKNEMKTNEETPLQSATPFEYRSATGKMPFVDTERDDIKYATKELSRGMSAPTEEDYKRCKRLARYLSGTRDVCLHLYPTEPLLPVCFTTDLLYSDGYRTGLR